MQSNLARGPRGVVAGTNKLHLGGRIELLYQLRHDLWKVGPEDFEARHGKVTNQGIAGLPH